MSDEIIVIKQTRIPSHASLLPIIEIEHTSAAMSQTSCVAITTSRVDAIVIFDTTHDNDRWRWEKSASNRAQCILCVPLSPPGFYLKLVLHVR